ncbi:MAG: hypothetical protein COB46_10655 [Rhodospirillaceae bacterium]|nr:MAG: hypothetical protein COB46_10655 [Rhodospirillaceae bacterium]
MPASKAPRRKSKSATKSTLVVLCMLSFMAIGAVAVVKKAPNVEFSFSQFFSIYAPTENAAISLGEVTLGSTMSAIRNTQPGATMGVTRSGDITLAFTDKASAFMVWYSEVDSRHVAYKARQAHTVKGISEDDYIGGLALKYGAPSLATCSRRVTDGIRDCHFSWWIKDDIRLDLTSRQRTKTRNSDLQVTLQITDTRLDLKLQRKTASKSASVKMF